MRRSGDSVMRPSSQWPGNRAARMRIEFGGVFLVDSVGRRDSVGTRIGSPAIPEPAVPTVKTLNHPRKTSFYVAWGTVLLVLVHLCWLQLSAGSELRRFTAILTTGEAGAGELDANEYCDRLVNQANVDDGSVLLRFVGYTAGNGRDGYVASLLYYRAGYILYPRRVYAAPEERIINQGRDILQAEFNPDLPWLRAHNVRSILTLRKDASGNQVAECEIIEPGEDSPGTQTGGAGGK